MVTTLTSTNANITNINSTGITTLGVTSTTRLTTQSVNSSGIVTASAYYVDGNQIISNSRELQNIASLDATTTATIEAAIANAPNTFTDLNVTGISTLNIAKISQLDVSGITTTARLNVGTGGTVITTTVAGLVGIGTTIPQTKLEINGVLGFTGSNNIKIGNVSTGSSLSYGSGENNFFAGLNAGELTTSGSNNNFFGSYAGNINTTGSDNIYIGQATGNANVTGSENVIIGKGQNAPILNGSNQLVIGAGSTSWITGNSSYNVGIGTTNPYDKLSVEGQVKATNIWSRESVYFWDGSGSLGSSYSYLDGTTDGILQIDNANLYINTNDVIFTSYSSGGSNQLMRLVSSSGNLGIGTTNPTSKLTVTGDVLVSGVLTATSFSGNSTSATYADNAGIATSVIGGIASVTQLNVSGVSTFTGNINATSATFSGNVSIGGTLTYEDVTNVDVIGVVTARSDVRVGGNLSVVGITTLASAGGITTTGGNLYVQNDLFFKGNLYQNGQLFTAGIGIGSTSVNPGSGTITSAARIGVGFTDINFVGTGLSVTGYGSTVVIDFGNISGGAGALSISTVTNPRIQDITFVGGASTSRIGISTQTDRFVYDTQTGSVGIGTSGSSIPGYKLDVIGDINSSTSVKIKGIDVLEEAVRLAIALG